MLRTRLLVGVALAALAGGAIAAGMHAAATGPLLYTIPVGQVSAVYSTFAVRGALTLDGWNGHTAVATIAGVRLLDTRAGTIMRTVPISQGYTTAIVADEHAGHFIVASDGITVLDARNGAVLRTTHADMGPLAIAVDARVSHAFILNGHGYGGDVSTVDTRTGRLLRTTMISSEGFSTGIAALVVDPRTNHVFVTSPGDDSVAMLDAQTGGAVTTSLVTLISTVVAVDARRGHVFVTGNSGVSMLDARSGAVIRNVPLGVAPLAVAVDGQTSRVFAVNSFTDAFSTATGIGGVSVLDARTGTVLHTISIAHNFNPAAITVDEQRGRVFVMSQGPVSSTRPYMFLDPGVVYVLDARTGRLLRTLPAGIGPIDMAIDEGTGHVVVLDSGGDVRIASSLDWAPASLRRWLSWLPSAQPHMRTVASSVSVLDPTR